MSCRPLAILNGAAVDINIDITSTTSTFNVVCCTNGSTDGIAAGSAAAGTAGSAQKSYAGAYIW